MSTGEKKGISLIGLILIFAIVILIVVAIVGFVTVNKKDSSADNKTQNVALATNEVATNVAENETTSEVVSSTEDLSSIMDKLYVGVPEENMPKLAPAVELTKDNIADYVGTSDFEFKEAIASEPVIGSIAHSVVLIRANSVADADSIVIKIEENVNPRKWVCVEASNVEIKSKGDLVLLIMSDEEKAPIMSTNFNNI